MLSALLFALQITLPNILLMALGFIMQRKQAVNQNFVETASDMVFSYCLPCLLFFSILKSDIHISQQLTLLSAGLTVTMSLFVLGELYAYFFVADKADKGVFVQGVFRSNMAIMGLATVGNAYGEQGLSIGAVYMGLITILYNVLAVITLSRSDTAPKTIGKKFIDVAKKIVTNPLIIALISAFIYKFSGLPMLPKFIVKTGELLSAVALPLALICAGATLDIKSMFQMSGVSMQASMARIVVAPLMAVGVGLAFGLTAVQMGVMFLMVASPVAAASYVMARSMGANDVLAANILGFTTIFSMVSLAVGMAVLRTLGWA
ncbi:MULTISPECIES: AEC family transporter [unclassified Moraxella]|uniref:AEC family transporter n=1 Tax=unclassified Moraxella TaxID=2685852 RepID=UPI003AF68B59